MDPYSPLGKEKKHRSTASRAAFMNTRERAWFRAHSHPQSWEKRVDSTSRPDGSGASPATELTIPFKHFGQEKKLKKKPSSAPALHDSAKANSTSRSDGSSGVLPATGPVMVSSADVRDEPALNKSSLGCSALFFGTSTRSSTSNQSEPGLPYSP